MEDRVADVLAQRAALDSGAGPGILLSLLFHAGFAALAIWAALHHPPPQLAGVLTIRFAPMTPATKPVQPVPQLRESAPEIEQPRPANPVPVPEKNTAPPSPFGQSAKKAAEAPPRPAPAPARPVSPEAAIAIGSAGVTGLEGGDFPYTIYIDNMKRLIGARWYRPDVSGGALTTVYFVIDRDGSIRDARTETPSGTGVFDRAALRAILETSPLPPLPFAYSGSFLGVHLTFR